MSNRRSPPHAVLTLFLAISSCVVPVSPEWTDPESNAPPMIGSANPPIGSILDFSVSGNAPLGVEVVLADQNTRDILYVRWIIDYPPYVDGPSRVALPWTSPGGDQIRRTSIRFAPNCKEDAIPHDSANHRLLLAVSDRPFMDDPQFLDRVQDGNYRVEASWDFTLSCP